MFTQLIRQRKLKIAMNRGRTQKRIPVIGLWHKLKELYQHHQVKKAADDERLMRIWRLSPYEFVRFDIVGRLQDQKFIALLAQEDPFNNVRAQAVKYLQDKELLRQIASTDTSDLVREIAKLHCNYTGPEPFYPREPDEEFEQSVKLFLDQRVAPADQPAGTEGKHPAPYRVIKPDKQNPVKRNRV